MKAWQREGSWNDAGGRAGENPLHFVLTKKHRRRRNRGGAFSEVAGDPLSSQVPALDTPVCVRSPDRRKDRWSEVILPAKDNDGLATCVLATTAILVYASRFPP